MKAKPSKHRKRNFQETVRKNSCDRLSPAEATKAPTSLETTVLLGAFVASAGEAKGSVTLRV